jgi:hypothetical protein
VLGACWLLTKFWEHLVIFYHFWDFENLSKAEHKSKRKSWDLDPFLGIFGFGDNVMGMGMLARGFTHA